MAAQESQIGTPLALSKYTKRAVLKSVVGRSDGGLSLVGQRIVIGGWVRSAKEVKKELPPPPPSKAVTEPAKAASKDVTCTEMLQAPVFRCIMKILGVSSPPSKEKLETAAKRPPTPSTVFLQVSDGSCVASLQVVVESELVSPARIMHSGTCILVEGIVQTLSSAGVKHVVELKVEKILHVGVVDHENYPLSKKRVPLDALRDWAHFRPRTTTVGSITRISSALTHATHTFFQNNSFLYVQVPIITSTDSEGFSDKFHVTTLLGKGRKDGPRETDDDDDGRGINLETIKASIKEKSDLVERLQRTDSNKEALLAAVQDLKKTNELSLQLESKEKAKAAKSQKAKKVHEPEKISFAEDFFACQAYLTVSGRLHLQSYACALGNVYSFGPRFKAQTLQPTKGGVAEMWMAEAEMAFAELEEAMSCSTDFLKFLCKWVLDNCSEDMKFILKRIDKTIAQRLQSVVSADFEKITYTEAIEILKQFPEKSSASNIEWGVSLTEEQEHFLADAIYRSPVIIYNPPKEMKPFYVRLNDDGKTVAAFDVIVPKVGVLIRGTQNEERIHILTGRIKELGLPKEQYEWYLDLRRQGTVKHGGFSLGFDIMVLLATGIRDAQNVIPFPRTYGKISH